MRAQEWGVSLLRYWYMNRDAGLKKGRRHLGGLPSSRCPPATLLPYSMLSLNREGLCDANKIASRVPRPHVSRQRILSGHPSSKYEKDGNKTWPRPAPCGNSESGGQGLARSRIKTEEAHRGIGIFSLLMLVSKQLLQILSLKDPQDIQKVVPHRLHSMKFVEVPPQISHIAPNNFTLFNFNNNNLLWVYLTFIYSNLIRSFRASLRLLFQVWGIARACREGRLDKHAVNGLC